LLAGNASERRYGSPARTGKCNKISKQIYKVIQHFTGQTWKKLRIIIVGWQAKRRQGDMGHLQCPENATRLVNKSTK
jgi:hypothetical protein